MDGHSLGKGVARTFGHPAQDEAGVTVRIAFDSVESDDGRGTRWTLVTPPIELNNAEVPSAPLVDVILNADLRAYNYVSPAGKKYEGTGPMLHSDAIKAAFTVIAAR